MTSSEQSEKPIKKDDQVKIPSELPVLPLRDMVVYPFIIAPLSVRATFRSKRSIVHSPATA